MTVSILPKYSKLKAELSKTKAAMHPSQAHGLLSAILCAEDGKASDWQTLLVGDVKKAKKALESLETLYHVTQSQLKNFSFDFQLFLPDDKETLASRAEALTLWCQGFLTGLKIINIPIVNREPSELTEAVNDLIEVAKIDYEEVVDNDEDETAYINLTEYVRMDVISICQELLNQGTTRSAAHVKNLH